jgi:hypothetical protein
MLIRGEFHLCRASTASCGGRTSVRIFSRSEIPNFWGDPDVLSKIADAGGRDPELEDCGYCWSSMFELLELLGAVSVNVAILQGYD